LGNLTWEALGPIRDIIRRLQSSGERKYRPFADGLVNVANRPFADLPPVEEIKIFGPARKTASLSFWHLALQPEQQLGKPLRIRERDQMASRKHLRVHLQAISSDESLELEGEEAVVR
jgi:hypothetical protein